MEYEDQERTGDSANPIAENTIAQERSNASLAGRRPSQRPTLRARPSQLLREQDAAPLSPTVAPSLIHRSSSKMSLFNLFSKPKVERARGHVEQGLAVHAIEEPSPPSAVKVEAPLPSRAPSGTLRKSGTPPQSTRERSHWEPPPLFQAYPQAIKHGVCEVSSLTAELALHLQKQRKAFAGKAGLPGDATNSSRGRQSSITKAGAAVELPKKVLILTTSGHLLLYSAAGSSERLPEKALPLSAGSAVFASDMIPGRHHVLQISLSADKRGVVTSSSGSLFSRFSLRSAANRREMQNCLLALASPEDMDSWLSTVRKEIRRKSGENQPRPDTTTKKPILSVNPSFNELKRTPSHSHRYRVKRDPSKIDLCSPTASEFSDTARLTVPASGRENVKRDDISETATLDGIEQEAAQLEQPDTSLQRTDREESETINSDTEATASSESQRSSNGEPRSPATEDTILEDDPISSFNPESLVKAETTDEQQAEGTESKSASSSESASQQNDKSDREVYAQSKQAETTSDRTLARVDEAAPLPVVSERTSSIAAKTGGSHYSAHVARSEIKRDSRYSQASADLDLGQSFDFSRRLSLRSSDPLATKNAFQQQRKSMLIEKPSRDSQSMRSSRQSMYGFSMPLKVNPSNTPMPAPFITDPKKRMSQNLNNFPAPPAAVHTLTAKVDASHRRLSLQTSAFGHASHDAFQQRVPRLHSVRRFPSLPSTTEFQMMPNSDTRNRRASYVRGPSPSSTSPQNAALALRRPNSIQIRSSHAPFLQSVQAPVARQESFGESISALPASGPLPIRALRPSRSVPLHSTSPVAAPIRRMSTAGTSRTLPVMEQIVTTMYPIESDEDDDDDEASDLPSPLPQEEALFAMVSRTSSWRSSQRRSRPPSMLPNVVLSIHSLGPPAPPPQAPLPPTPKVGAPPPNSRSSMPLGPPLITSHTAVQTLPPQALHEAPLSPLRMHPPVNGLGISV